MKTLNFGNPHNNDTPVMYALVRFRPFAETEEFANVGVLVCCPELNFIDYRMIAPQVNRVPQFFDRFDKTQYKAIITDFAKVLKNLVEQGRNTDSKDKRYLFEAFVHPREAVITLSNYRVVMSENPRNELNRLFEHYVRQNFDAKISAEQQAEKAIKAIIKDTGRIFIPKRIGDGEMSVAFPFVNSQAEKLHKVIKPLFLGQEKIQSVYEHGDVWVGKVRRIRHHLPAQTLFTINGNTHKKAIEEITHELQQQDIIVQPYDAERIKLFAIH